MRMELIGTVPDAMVGDVVTAHGPMSYSDIILVYKCTNQAAQQASLNDVTGMLTIKHAGSQSRLSMGLVTSVNRPQSLLTLWEAWRGRVAELSTAGGAYRGVLITPFHLGLNGKDRNVLFSGPGERVVIYVPPIDPAGAHLDAAAANICEVYGVLKHGGMAWCPRITDRPITLGGNQKEAIPAHTACIVLSEQTTNPDEIRIMRGSELLSEGSWDGLYYAGQAYYHNDSVPYNADELYLDFTDLGYEKNDALGDGQHIVIVNGTGTIVMMTLSMDLEFAAKQTKKSAEYYTEEMISKVAVLTAEGVSPTQIAVNLPQATRISPVIAKAVKEEIGPSGMGMIPSYDPSGYNSMGG